uniref:Ig-like domain-containing protein n=1 Tax=Pundamilia nyererei TaxID=303518 RepID=A0A3B4GD25_9CICH
MLYLNGSGCVLQSEVLTCVCISEGFPLPTVKWPFLKNSTDYSVFTTVSNHTVNSTVSLTVKNNGSTTLECVSNNGMGEAEESLTIQKNLPDNNSKYFQPNIFEHQFNLLGPHLLMQSL